MVKNVELATFDLRYEAYRIRNKRDEARLLDSIAQRGIENPLEGVDTEQGRFLLNGFKRYRCAKKLMVDCVPYVSMGQDEVLGIVDLLRSANDHALVILEQARFIDDLLSTHQMSLAEVAQRLSRSKSWVSMRQGLSRRLAISRNAVRTVIKQEGKMPDCVRKDKIHIDRELLERLHHECDGWIQRVHEKLTEEEGVQVGYPTLTRMLREMGISRPCNTRCDRVPDQPGDEMQHDTSPYQVKLSGKRTKVVASMMYLRYSKRRYLKFYRNFNRFSMKCFFHEALMHWAYSAKVCIIDNTNLARLRGTGKNAVMCPEMGAFSERYSFKFVCHAIRHSNRKAGEERSFWIVETNFFPGRKFESLKDLNRQALAWSTVRIDGRPAKRTGLIPAKVFEHERKFLTELPSYLPAPYRSLQRDTDQYGFIPYGGNDYWVPGTGRGTMKVFVYADRLKIYRHRTCVAEYPLAPDGVKNAHFSPEGQPKPRYRPKKKRSSHQEEKHLRAMGPEMAAYLDYALKVPGIQRHRFLHQLHTFSHQVTSVVLMEMAQRALKYRISRLETLKRITWYCMSRGESILPEPEVDDNLQDRPVYQEGCLTDEPDFTVYDQMLLQEQEVQEHERDDPEENDHE